MNICVYLKPPIAGLAVPSKQSSRFFEKTGFHLSPTLHLTFSSTRHKGVSTDFVLIRIIEESSPKTRFWRNSCNYRVFIYLNISHFN